MSVTRYSEAEVLVSAAEAFFKKFEMVFKQEVRIQPVREMLSQDFYEIPVFAFSDFFHRSSPSQELLEFIRYNRLAPTDAIVSEKTDLVRRKTLSIKYWNVITVENENRVIESFQELQSVIKRAYIGVDNYKSNIFCNKDKASVLSYRLHILDKESNGSMDWLNELKR